MEKYVPVGDGMYEEVVRWDGSKRRRIPVTNGELISEEEYLAIQQRKADEAESLADQPQAKRRTRPMGLGDLAVGNLIKI